MIVGRAEAVATRRTSHNINQFMFFFMLKHAILSHALRPINGKASIA